MNDTVMTAPWGSFQSLLQPQIDTTQDDESGDLFDAALLFLDQYEDTASVVASPGSSHSDSMNNSEAESLDGVNTPLADDLPLWQLNQTMEDHVASIDKNALQVQVKLSQSDGLVARSAWLYQQPPPATKPPPRRNKRREEIERLKVEMQQLQARLATLQLSASKPIVKREVADLWLGQVVGTAWQNIAANQRRRRLQSEEENRKLRDRVNEQRRLSKALRRLINRQVEAKEMAQFRPPQPPPFYNSHAADEKMLDDPAVFDVLMTSLIPMQLQTDMVFADPELTMLSTSYRTFSTEGKVPEAVSVRHLDSRIVPFNVADVADAMWSYFLHPGGQKMYTWEQVDHRTYQGRFVGFTNLGEYKGNTCAKMVVRRIDEPHRVVIMRSSVFRCIDLSRQHPFLRLPMRHFLWAVIEKPRHPKLQSSSEPLSQISMSDVSLPRLQDSTVSDSNIENDVAAIVDVSLDISRLQADKSHEYVDNYLLSRQHVASVRVDPVVIDVAV